MTTPPCHQPVGWDTLVEYWLGELDADRARRIDEHLLGCEPCGARLDDVIALVDAVRRAFDAGQVGTAVGAAFARRLAERGLRLREYRVQCNGRVNCSVGPDDDVVISRLEAPLAGVGRLDVVRSGAPGEPEVRSADIPFDAVSGEVVFVAPAARLRAMPSHVHRMRLLAVDAAGERVVGEYTFVHQASA